VNHILIGFLLAVVLILAARKIFPKKDVELWRTGLVVAAVIYVGFVLLGGATNQLPMELGGVVMYGTIAWLSKKYTLHWLAAGWALHICWDVFLHSKESTPYVPEGYAALCIGFDIAIAGYIAYKIWERQSLKSISHSKTQFGQ